MKPLQLIIWAILIVAGFFLGRIMQHSDPPGARPPSDHQTLADRSKSKDGKQYRSPAVPATPGLVKALEAELGDEEFRQLLEEVAKAPSAVRAIALEVIYQRWLKQRPQSALEQAVIGGTNHMVALFKAWSRFPDPGPAWKAVRSHVNWIPLVLEGIAERDPETAWDMLRMKAGTEPWDKLSYQASERIFRKWARHDPEECLAVLKAHDHFGKQRFGNLIQYSLMLEFLKTDPDRAFEFENSGEVFGHWFASNPAAARVYFLSLPEDSSARLEAVRERAVPFTLLSDADLVWQMSHDPSPFFDLDSDTSPPMERLKAILPEHPEILLPMAVQWGGERSPEDGFHWARENLEGEQQELFLRELISTWNAYAPGSMWALLNELPPDREYLDLAVGLENDDPFEEGGPAPEGTAERMLTAVRTLSAGERATFLQEDQRDRLSQLIRSAPQVVSEFVGTDATDDPGYIAIRDWLSAGSSNALQLDLPTIMEQLSGDQRNDLVRAANDRILDEPDPFGVEALAFLEFADDPQLAYNILLESLPSEATSTELTRDQIEEQPVLTSAQRSELLRELEFQERLEYWERASDLPDELLTP